MQDEELLIDSEESLPKKETKEEILARIRQEKREFMLAHLRIKGITPNKPFEDEELMNALDTEVPTPSITLIGRRRQIR